MNKLYLQNSGLWFLLFFLLVVYSQSGFAGDRNRPKTMYQIDPKFVSYYLPPGEVENPFEVEINLSNYLFNEHHESKPPDFAFSYHFRKNLSAKLFWSPAYSWTDRNLGVIKGHDSGSVAAMLTWSRDKKGGLVLGYGFFKSQGWDSYETLAKRDRDFWGTIYKDTDIIYHKYMPPATIPVILLGWRKRYSSGMYLSLYLFMPWQGPMSDTEAYSSSNPEANKVEFSEVYYSEIYGLYSSTGYDHIWVSVSYSF